MVNGPSGIRRANLATHSRVSRRLSSKQVLRSALAKAAVHGLPAHLRSFAAFPTNTMQLSCSCGSDALTLLLPVHCEETLNSTLSALASTVSDPPDPSTTPETPCRSRSTPASCGRRTAALAEVSPPFTVTPPFPGRVDHAKRALSVLRSTRRTSASRKRCPRGDQLLGMSEMFPRASCTTSSPLCEEPQKQERAARLARKVRSARQTTASAPKDVRALSTFTLNCRGGVSEASLLPLAGQAAQQEAWDLLTGIDWMDTC